MKILTIIMRILFILILVTPVLGSLGVFPPPTADLYSPPGWAFMEALMNTGYMLPLIALTCGVCVVLALMNKMALAAVILAPFTVNVLCFHAFLDGSLLSINAGLAWVLIITNVYFLWVNREKYRVLW